MWDKLEQLQAFFFFSIIQGTAEMGYQGLHPASPETEDREQQNMCVENYSGNRIKNIDKGFRLDGRE